MSKALLLTLGHNSSALFVKPDSKPIGYEEERLNKQKSSSAFPRLSIEMIEKYVGDDLHGADVYISHWFDHFEMEKFPSKYFDHGYFAELVKKYKLNVITLNENMTHHDAHAYSSKAFFDNFSDSKEQKHYIVVDGFGNNQEVISIYIDDQENPALLKKIYQLNGYEKSLGLMYQYATSFCDMKENQDEYKFLGYESHIGNTVFKQKHIDKLNSHIERFINAFEFQAFQSQINYFLPGEDIINFDDLKIAKQKFYNMFDAVIDDPKIKNMNIIGKRIVIGYFIQNCIEKALLLIIKKFNIKNVCLSGGCFYNVKLNNAILHNIEGFICVTPLAGDQGAAIGMYKRAAGDFNFADLCFGKRELTKIDKIVPDNRIIFINNEDDFVDYVARKVNQGYIVNAVSNEMEFGPRALCNTSTLAIATQENVEYINMLNDRNTVMPMAPVMLEENANLLFDNINDLKRVIGSNEYMIITHDYAEPVQEYVMGAAHPYAFGKGHSGRPQIVKDTDRTIGKILKAMLNPGTIINTSFNTHGNPILYSVDDCIADFLKQRANDNLDRTYLVILTND